MTPGLKLSLAARAAASNAGRSSSVQRIRRKAKSREIGDPGGRSTSSAVHDELGSLVAGTVAVGVTVFGFRQLADASNHTTVVSGPQSAPGQYRPPVRCT